MTIRHYIEGFWPVNAIEDSQFEEIVRRHVPGATGPDTGTGFGERDMDFTTPERVSPEIFEKIKAEAEALHPAVRVYVDSISYEDLDWEWSDG